MNNYKIKQEVNDLCIKLINAKKGSKEFKETQILLQKKYKFTTFSLLTLFYKKPFIEYDENNMNLIME